MCAFVTASRAPLVDLTSTSLRLRLFASATFFKRFANAVAARFCSVSLKGFGRTAFTVDRPVLTAPADVPPIIPSPTACLGSTLNPALVFTVAPVCSMTLCRDSVPNSLSADAKILPPPRPSESSSAIPAVDVETYKKSSLFGLSLPWFLARSSANGPKCCTALKITGAAMPPTMAPPGPSVEPTAAPPALAIIWPANCAPCSIAAFGKYLQA